MDWMEAERVAKFLLDYGPAALLVIAVFVVERRFRQNLNNPDPNFRKISVRLYIANWCAIALLAAVVIGVFAIRLASDATTKVGTFEGLARDEVLDIASGFRYFDHAHTTRTRGSALASKVTFDWILHKRGRLDSNGSIDFYISARKSAGTTEAEIARQEQESLGFSLPLSFLGNGGEFPIVYDRDAQEAHLNIKEEQIQLKRLGYRDVKRLSDANDRNRLSRLFRMIGRAVAAEAPDFAIAKQFLESDDIRMRREARTALAELGPAAMPWIDRVLTDAQSSYALRLGAIVALIKMPDKQSNVVSDGAMGAIVEAATNDDPVMRYNARIYLRNHPLDTVIERIDKEIEAASNVQASRVSHLARAQLDILYNRSVDRFILNSDAGSDEYAAAVDDLNRAWAYRGRAGEEDRMDFGKAVWGLALTHHKQYFLTLKKNGKPDDDLRSRLTETLITVRDETKAPEYKYWHHAELASLCLVSLVEDCVDPEAQADALAAKQQPRIFIHIEDESQRAGAKSLQQEISKIKVSGKVLAVPDIRQVDSFPKNTQLRFLKSADADEARNILAQLRPILSGRDISLVDLSQTFDSASIRPRTYELWLASASPN